MGWKEICGAGGRDRKITQRWRKQKSPARPGDVDMRLKKGIVEKITFQPGDKLVVQCDGPVSCDQADYITRYVHQWAPEVPVLVMGSGMRLTHFREVKRGKKDETKMD